MYSPCCLARVAPSEGKTFPSEVVSLRLYGFLIRRLLFAGGVCSSLHCLSEREYIQCEVGKYKQVAGISIGYFNSIYSCR